MKKKVIITAVAIVTVFSFAACGSSSGTETTVSGKEEPVTETVNEEITEGKNKKEYKWDAGNLADYGFTRSEILAICKEYGELLTNDVVLDMDYEQEVEYENHCAEQVAEEYGLTGEDVDHIYRTAMMPNYFATFDVNEVDLKYGELKSVLVNGGMIVINAKITPSLTDKMTIEQNYYTVCDFIRDYVGEEEYDEISYWAVADMTDGSENKCISFTVPKKIIERVATTQFPDNTLGDYVENLWIIPSLRD